MLLVLLVAERWKPFQNIVSLKKWLWAKHITTNINIHTLAQYTIVIDIRCQCKTARFVCGARFHSDA